MRHVPQSMISHNSNHLSNFGAKNQRSFGKKCVINYSLIGEIWRIFCDIDKGQICEILYIFSKHSPSFPCSPLSPIVLRVRRAFSRSFGNILNSHYYSGIIWPKIPKQLLFSSTIHKVVASYSPNSRLDAKLICKIFYRFLYYIFHLYKVF